MRGLLPTTSIVFITSVSMDPLSGAASVIAIIGATNVMLKNIYQLRIVLKAPEAIDALIDDVQALRALLRDAEEAQELLQQVHASPYQFEFG